MSRQAMIGLVLLTTFTVSRGADLMIDCARTHGRVRPFHGLNCGPITGGGLVDLSAFYRELAPPLVRLHDCHWPNPDVVDIHVLFPDRRADAALPSSYDFSCTDEYLSAIVRTGSGIVFRLGESIEHTKRKVHVHPPPDPRKWADICLGIIRHYNEGWAKGYRNEIRYWEIWNEPENRPAMWTGTDEDYFRLYSVTAKAIKARFPGVLVGGPAVGYTGKMVAKRFEPSPFVGAFLKRCRKDAAPLDFFSWHIYTNDPVEVARRARVIRGLLDKHGFSKTESHLNEWNYLPGKDWTPLGPKGQGLARQRWYQEMGGPKGAAFVAGTLLLLQDCPLDVSNFYRGDTGGFGLFNCHGVPNKTFYALKAFKVLADTPDRLRVQGDLPNGLAMCAGTRRGQTEVTVLLSNFGRANQKADLVLSNLPWRGPTDCQVLRIDADRDLEQVQRDKIEAKPQRLVVQVKAATVVLVRLRSHAASPRRGK